MSAVRVAPGLLPPLPRTRRKTRGSGRTAWGILVPAVTWQPRALQWALSGTRHRSPRPGLLCWPAPGQGSGVTARSGGDRSSPLLFPRVSRVSVCAGGSRGLRGL